MPLPIFGERVLLNGSAWYGDNNVSNAHLALYVSNGYDSEVDAIQMSNSDSVDHKMLLTWNGNAPLANVIEITVPARAGYDGNPPIDALAIWQPSIAHFLLFQTGVTLYWQCADVIGAGLVVTAYIMAASV